ncbi:MAG: zf-HC2 domain-containing protein [Eubacterium sp.]|nr:zf-HC2 domain-containing protein [Eubacterium sp.]
MNHLEAQSYIMPFIEGKMPDSKRLEFAMHMKNCKACHDELEIYYTLMTGMQILQDPEASSGNFSKDLEAKLDRTFHKAKNRRGIRVSMFTIITIGIALIMVFFYGRCLTLVYAYEQETKQEAQGEYYFLRRWERILFPTEDRVSAAMEYSRQKEEDRKDPDLYRKIRGYRDLSEYSDKIQALGVRIAHEKAETLSDSETGDAETGGSDEKTTAD